MASTPPGRVPRRPYGTLLQNERLPPDLPIVGLGCSSFSTFFWTKEDHSEGVRPNDFTVKSLSRDHPMVQEWIRTIHYAVGECGINLLDTAPWYGHGTSEIVIGYAMKTNDFKKARRSDLILATKVGRFEADPLRQFDFSYEATLASVQRSLRRMDCDYIDILQLHDPEFAPSLDQLFVETIPAMRHAQSMGWCKALGLTGYPLHVQYQILQRSLEEFGIDEAKNIWDQSLTYGHFNLHDTSLIERAPCFEMVANDSSRSSPPDPFSFGQFCHELGMGVLAAAPLSMGLLTPHDHIPPEWHPASQQLKQACHQAATIVRKRNQQSKKAGTEPVNLATIATVFALAQPSIACTIIGCKSVEEVERAAEVARRFSQLDLKETDSKESWTSIAPGLAIIQQVLNPIEKEVFDILRDPVQGPFADVWRNKLYYWDGVAEAKDFWKSVAKLDASPSIAPSWHDDELQELFE